MSQAKTLSVREQLYLDSLKLAARQSPAEKIRAALKLSDVCLKLFAATGKKHERPGKRT
jgi:hypothetical protein